MLNFPRHFALLASLAALSAITSPWRIAPGLNSAFAFYGALHASALAAALYPRRPAWRLLLFVALAATLCMSMARLGFYGLEWSGKLSDVGGPVLVLVTVSLAGALAYGILIRSCLDYPFRGGSMALTALACGCATWGASFAAGRHPAVGSACLAIAWWFAFSGGLWCASERRAPPQSNADDQVPRRVKTQ